MLGRRHVPSTALPTVETTFHNLRARQATYRAPSLRQDDMCIWVPWANTFLPQTGSAIGGLPRTGSRKVASVDRDHDRGAILIISDARVLDLLFRSKKPNKPVTLLKTPTYNELDRPIEYCTTTTNF